MMKQAPTLAMGIEVQPGSIVSKTLLKNQGGNVTLFGFGAGEGLSEHTAPFDALIIGVEGQAEVSVGTEKALLTPGTSITLPANVPHAVQCREDFMMLLIMIRGDKTP